MGLHSLHPRQLVSGRKKHLTGCPRRLLVCLVQAKTAWSRKQVTSTWFWKLLLCVSRAIPRKLCDGYAYAVRCLSILPRRNIWNVLKRRLITLRIFLRYWFQLITISNAGCASLLQSSCSADRSKQQTVQYKNTLSALAAMLQTHCRHCVVLLQHKCHQHICDIYYVRCAEIRSQASYLPNSKANNWWSKSCNSKIAIIYCMAFWEVTCLRALMYWWFKMCPWNILQ